jgi:HD domain
MPRISTEARRAKAGTFRTWVISCRWPDMSSRPTAARPKRSQPLLHDTAEDQGGDETLAEIRVKFGDEVANIVRECSDTVVTPKPPWRERKENYVNHLHEASDSAVLVSLADKLHNAHAILRDFRAHGVHLWERFSVKDPADHLWYYRSLLAVYRARFPHNWMADELHEVIATLEREVSSAA